MGDLGDMLVAQTGLFLRRLGPARFERRPTVVQSLEILVGRRGETPLSHPTLKTVMATDNLTHRIASCLLSR